MNQREIRARIRAIQRQIEALLREFNYLITLLEPGRDKPQGGLRVIRGGLAAFTALAALAGWLRRRPAALVGAAIAAGTSAIVLIAPQGGTAPVQQLSLPPAASLSTPTATHPTTPTSAPSTAATKATPAPSPTAVARPPEWVYLSPAQPTPTTSGTAPAMPGSAPPLAPAPTAEPTPSRCVIEATVPGILHVCVGG